MRTHTLTARVCHAACEARAVGGASRTVDAEQRAPEADARQQSRADERGRRADNQHDRHDEPIPAQCTLAHARASTSGRAQLERNSACAQTRARTQWRSASAQTRSTFLQYKTGMADGIPGGMVSRAAIGGATRRALRTERIRAYARACTAKRMRACARADGQHGTNTDTRSLAHACRRAYRRLRRFLTRRRCRSSASRGR